MLKTRIDNPKPRVNIGIIGQTGHGKTTLATAITRVLTHPLGGETKTSGQPDAAPEKCLVGITIPLARVEYQTETRGYAQIDFPSHADCIKAMIGAAQMDGAILVVDATDGPLSETREQVLLAHQVGVPHLVVFLNKVDAADSQRIAQAEGEVRDLLSSCQYPDDKIPFIKGSSRLALDNADTSNGAHSLCIQQLMDALDSFIPDPVPPTHKPFQMPVLDVFALPGCGPLVTGHIEQGFVKVGEEIEIVGLWKTVRKAVTGIRVSNTPMDQGQTGENVGLLLCGTHLTDVERGQVLAQPGSITPHTRFKAQVYVLTKEEGGRHTPCCSNYRPQFAFRTTVVPGSIELEAGRERVMPGDHVALTVELSQPIAMAKGLKFTIRESGGIVGLGRVSEILA